MPEVSVTMAYFNRPDLLRRTLWAYYHLHGADRPYEFVIVDDKSDDDLRAEPIADELADVMDMKLIYRQHKESVNASVPVNVSVRESSGEILIITNPETMPLTPVLDQMVQARQVLGGMGGKYVVTPCYSVSLENQARLSTLDVRNPDLIAATAEAIVPEARAACFDGDSGWYEHPVYNPRAFYFLAGMLRSDFVDMGGMDEDFANGWGWEDDDFLRRLQLKGTDVMSLPDSVCLHQHHYSSRASEKAYDRQHAFEANRAVFEAKSRTQDWRANLQRDWGRL